MEGESWGSWLGKGLEAGGGGREWREEGICELDPCAQPVLPAPVKEDGHSRQNLAPPECDRQGVWLSGGAQRQGN